MSDNATMKNTTIHDMTTGSPARLIMQFMIPMFLGNIFQQFYNIADSIIAGQFLGVRALAAIGSTGSLMFFVTGWLNGLSSGFAILVSQWFGAKEYERMRHYVAMSIYLSAGWAVLMTIGLGIAIVTLITSGKNIVKVIKGVDYKTLLFFIGLFVVVGGLEQTNVLKLIAEFIGSVSGGNLYVMVAIIIWVSAIASAFVDNIPFAATMVPVIQSLAALNGVNISTLAWGLSMGTDIGGSATPIGASANVVGMSVIAKEGHIVGWGKYCKSAVPATIIVMVVATVGIWLRYC